MDNAAHKVSLFAMMTVVRHGVENLSRYYEWVNRSEFDANDKDSILFRRDAFLREALRCGMLVNEGSHFILCHSEWFLSSESLLSQ